MGGLDEEGKKGFTTDSHAMRQVKVVCLVVVKLLLLMIMESDDRIGKHVAGDAMGMVTWLFEVANTCTWGLRGHW